MKKHVQVCLFIMVYFLMTFHSGAQWVKMSGSSGITPRCFLKDGSTIYAAGSGSLVIKSTDGGTTWTTSNTGISGPDLMMGLARFGSDIYLCGNNSGVFKSSGTSWTMVNSGIIGAKYLQTIVATDSGLLAGSGFSAGIYKTTNGGANWVASNNGMLGQTINSLQRNGNEIWAGTNSYFVFISTDGGNNWFVRDSSFNSGVLCLSFDGSKAYAGKVGSYIAVSSDHGASWTDLAKINGGPTGIYAVAASGTKIYAAAGGVGIVVSQDGGTTWSLMNNGLDYTNGNAFLIEGNDIFVGVSAGVYKRSLSDMSGLEDLSTFASRIQLYPNPAKNEVEISIDAAGSSNGNQLLEILDVKGEVIYSGTFSGKHTLSTEQFTAGLYLVKISGEDKVALKRLVKE